MKKTQADIRANKSGMAKSDGCAERSSGQARRYDGEPRYPIDMMVKVDGCFVMLIYPVDMFANHSCEEAFLSM